MRLVWLSGRGWFLARGREGEREEPLNFTPMDHLAIHMARWSEGEEGDRADFHTSLLPLHYAPVRLYNLTKVAACPYDNYVGCEVCMDVAEAAHAEDLAAQRHLSSRVPKYSSSSELVLQ